MRFQRPVSEEPEINLIPFIDVLLVVLIFLMVTTTYSKYAELHINLPTTSIDHSVADVKKIDVAITSENRLLIEKVSYAFDDLQYISKILEEMSRGRQDVLLVINADGKASHESVVHLMEAAQRAGIVKVSFATHNVE